MSDNPNQWYLSGELHIEGETSNNPDNEVWQDHFGHDNIWGKFTKIAAGKMWGLQNGYGILQNWGSDHLFVGLKDEGLDRKDAVIAFGDNDDDSLRILFSGYGAPPPAPKELLRVTASGNVGIGTVDVKRTLQVEGHEIHSGGPTGGFSFGNRGSSFVETPPNGERWVWYSIENKARLWSGNDKLCITSDGKIGIGTTTPSGRLTIAGVMQPYHGYLTIFPDTADFEYDGGSDRLFIFKDTAGGTTSFLGGNVGIGTTSLTSKLHVAGNAGVLSLEGIDHAYIQWYPGGLGAGRKAWIGFGNRGDSALSICNEMPGGRMHIAGDELLFLLNKAGVVVSKAWGGNGNLTVEGNIAVGGTFQLNGGAVFSKFQTGTTSLGSNGVDKGSVSFSISFPQPFSSIPKVIATARDVESHGDVFVVSTKGIHPNGFSINVRRLDSWPVNTWGQNLHLDWFAWI
ncbi:H-type lectin domain-containing protein [Nitrosomonas sp.]|uniref:H-type lectin domain-containing protein n=1 Tax=Nitrosomonas sp. TaxID=42353 RepID=UPI0026380F75|nr:H-type lectin domain-containing protein [Nitrosomonas sp.]